MARPSTTDIPLRTGAQQARYSSVAILLHWLIALALAFQLALGFAMPKDESGFALYQLHKSVGITILLLTLARLVWRVTHRPPPAVEGGFSGFLAKAVHTLLYVFMIAAPLTGWALVSTSPVQVPTVFWGVIPWPHLPLPIGINETVEATHELLAWTGLALIVLHLAGALRHQLLLRDGLLRRMSPARSAAVGFALLALVVLTYFGTGMYVASRYLVPSIERQEAAASAPAAPEAAEPIPTPSPTAEATPAAEETAIAEADDPGPPPTWSIQPGGRLGFSVASGDSTIRGSFSDWGGTIRFDPDDPDSAEIRINVGLASVSLGDATQDSMIQAPEFFGTSANPTATWRSTSVRRTGPNRYSASGTLSLKGVSRPQSLTFALTGDGLRRHVEGTASIDRTAFGVGTGESAAGLASSVALSFAFDATGRRP